MSKYVDQNVDVIKEVFEGIIAIIDEYGFFEVEYFGDLVEQAIANVAKKHRVTVSTVKDKLTRQSEINGINDYKQLLFDLITRKNDALVKQILGHLKTERGDDNPPDVKQQIEAAIR